MSENDPFDCERLRPPEYVTVPDPRTQMFVMIDPVSDRKSPKTIYHQHQAVSKFSLNSRVPESVVIKFETAKNLYLYAWYVYRFHNIAEHEVLGCLEMALRERLREFFPFPDEYWPSKKKYEPTLKPLLRYAIDIGLVQKEGFRAWRERGEAKARLRFMMEASAKLDETGADFIEYDESDIVVTPEDEADWDYLATLLDFLPFFRNEYAHGSTHLDSAVLRSFEVASEFINQLYPDPQDTSS